MTSRPISNIMLTKKSGWKTTKFHAPGWATRPASSLLLACGFPCRLLREFVFNVLFEQTGISAHNASPIDKDCGRAVHVELLTVCAAGVDSSAGFRAGHAGLERIRVYTGLAGVVHHFRPGVRRGYDLLIVINEVIHLPEGLGVLLVGAPASNGRRSCPRMELLEGIVLENDTTTRTLPA